MLKFIVLGMLVTISAFAAAPKVGDSATYDLHTSQSPGDTGTLTWELVSFDAAANTSLLNQTITIRGNTKVDQVANTYEALTLGDRDMTYCTAQGGVADTIEVPAGRYTTCRIAAEDANSQTTVWFSGVPVLSMVKFIQISKADNSKTEIDLREFKKAL